MDSDFEEMDDVSDVTSSVNEASRVVEERLFVASDEAWVEADSTADWVEAGSTADWVVDSSLEDWVISDSDEATLPD